ncbi:ABC transporter permease [Alistipes dispar]|uniref:ABC transporter permease n=1 Tax=Alistipes dispar TaxID=2585119 RepID=UPI003A8780B5
MRVILKNLFTALRRYPAAVALNVAGLAVAFAAFLVILIEVRFEYGFDTCHPGSERIFRVEMRSPELADSWFTMLNYPLISDLAGSSAHIEAASALEMLGPGLELEVLEPNGERRLFRETVKRCNSSFVRVLGLRLTEGDAAGLNTSAGLLLPRSLARRMFGDEPAVGRIVRIGGETCTVCGVYADLPANSVFPNWICRGGSDSDFEPFRSSHNYMCFIRLDSPASRDEVAAEMNRRIRAFYGSEEVGVRLTCVRDIYFARDILYDFPTKGNRRMTDILLAVAVLVIVIASINFVNFASALAPVRMKLINLQKILGAGVPSLRLSLLAESVAVAFAAYLAALCLVGCLAGTPFAGYVDADMSFAANRPLVGWCALVALGVGLVAGLYPAFYMTSFRPVLAVRGTFSHSAAGRRYRMALVGVQYVISIGLIVAALFVGLQNRYLRRYPTGYDRNRVVVVSLTSGALERRDALVGALKSRAEIEEVAFAFQRFGAEENFSGWARPYRDRGDISFRVLVVTPEFLRVLGVRPSEGRDFSDADPLREQGTYIFNQTARRRWDMRPGDCISETRHVSGWGEIAGFLPDGFRAYSRHRAEDPFALFVPGTVGWTLPLSYCYIRIAPGADLSAAVEHIRRSLHSVTPLEPDIEFLDTAVDTLYRKDFRAGVLVSAFSALAIFVSLMGVFGLVLFETQHRRKEIGIRKVCGATSASVLRMFNLRFVRIVLASFLVAAPLARYGVSVWLRGFVDAVPLSAWVFFAALAIVLAITVLTVTVRSWRTAGENPVDSVKTE